MDPDQKQLTLEIIGPRHWLVAVCWREFEIEFGYVRNTTTPPWTLMKVWRVGLFWPPLRQIVSHFTTPELFREIMMDANEEEGSDSDGD